jgi:hypothetical protein
LILSARVAAYLKRLWLARRMSAARKAPE